MRWAGLGIYSVFHSVCILLLDRVPKNVQDLTEFCFSHSLRTISVKEDSVNSQMFNNIVLLPFPDTYLIGIHREILSVFALCAFPFCIKLCRNLIALRSLCFIKSSHMDVKGIQVDRKMGREALGS